MANPAWSPNAPMATSKVIIDPGALTRTLSRERAGEGLAVVNVGG
jgi:hypothetical protein